MAKRRARSRRVSSKRSTLDFVGSRRGLFSKLLLVILRGVQLIRRWFAREPGGWRGGSPDCRVLETWIPECFGLAGRKFDEELSRRSGSRTSPARPSEKLLCLTLSVFLCFLLPVPLARSTSRNALPISRFLSPRPFSFPSPSRLAPT